MTSEFPAQRPVTRKMFPFDDVIMNARSGWGRNRKIYTIVFKLTHVIPSYRKSILDEIFVYIVTQFGTFLVLIALSSRVNTLRPRQDGRHFADDIFKCIFFNENV